MDGKVLLFQIGKKKLLQTFVHSVPSDTTVGATAGGAGAGSGTASSIADTTGLALPNPPPRKAASASTASASASAVTTKAQQQDHDHDHDISEAEFGDYDETNMMDGDDEDEGDEGGTLSVECVGFSSTDLKWVASGGLDKTMKVWDMVSGSCRCVCVHGGSVIALKWHAVLPIVTTASLDRAVRLWDARGGNKQTKQTRTPHHSTFI